jgi:subtilisin family serine protease
VLSMSWTGPQSTDIEFALEDALAQRGGKGAVLLAATGNDSRRSVGYPARDPNVIGVGACTDRDLRASYSNYGPQVALVAPSSGGDRGIYTTDVSLPRRGFNVGTSAAGDAAGCYTNDFGGTSSATPLAAGVAALVLSANPELSSAEVRQVLQESARKIGNIAYDDNGRNDEYGHGCIEAQQALQHPLV